MLLSREEPSLVDAQYTKNQAWKSDAVSSIILLLLVNYIIYFYSSFTCKGPKGVWTYRVLGSKKRGSRAQGFHCSRFAANSIRAPPSNGAFAVELQAHSKMFSANGLWPFWGFFESRTPGIVLRYSFGSFQKFFGNGENTFGHAEMWATVESLADLR